MKFIPSSKHLIFLSLVLNTILLLTQVIETSAVTYNVAKMATRGGGRQANWTEALLSAWDSACASAKPATIYVPRARYIIGKAHFDGGNCKSKAITFRIMGTFVAPTDYHVVGHSGSWIQFQNVNGVHIVGGRLDGQGAGLWACKASGKDCPIGATALAFYNSKNIKMTGLTSINSQKFHIAIVGCENVKLQAIKVLAPGTSPNTDGIHVEKSSRVTILKSKISTGDDCISIGPGSFNLWIENILCGPGHGISIGSLGWELEEAGVQNVTVKTVHFVGADNGVRIKTWGRPSHGFVNQISFQHLIMSNVRYPIIIDQNYCPHNINCPGQSSGVKISDVAYVDIRGSSATSVGVKFDCSKKNPCDKIKMDNVKLTYKEQPAVAYCVNAAGSSSRLLEANNCL